jgi:hypothetical protein
MSQSYGVAQFCKQEEEKLKAGKASVYFESGPLDRNAFIRGWGR